MQCPNCSFENMPGRQTCTRCGAALARQPDQPAAAFQPPRAGRGKALRPLRYAANRLRDRLPFPLLAGMAGEFAGVAAAVMVASLIPGLGHLLDGRWRAALVALAAWLGLLAFAAFYHTGMVGALGMGLLVGGHVSIAMHAGQVWRHVPARARRLRLVLYALLVLGAVYYWLDRLVVARYVDFLASAMAVDGLELGQGDVLLMRRVSATDPLRRGDIVAATRRDNDYPQLPTGLYPYVYLPPSMMGIVLALPGDRVGIADGTLRLNGQVVPRAKLPAGDIALPGPPLSLSVDNDHVVVVSRLAMTPPDATYRAFVWRQVYWVPRSDVNARAVAIYTPLARRRFLSRGNWP